MYTAVLSRRSLSLRCDGTKKQFNQDAEKVRTRVNEVFKSMADRKQKVESDRVQNLQRMHDAVKKVFLDEIEYVRSVMNTCKPEKEKEKEAMDEVTPSVVEEITKEEKEDDVKGEAVFVEKSKKDF